MIAALFLSLALFISGTASAQNIGNWTFNGILTGTPGALNTVSIADFSPAVPVHSFNGGTEYYGENGWPTGALNTSMYLQFSLTPLAGYQLDITSLILRLRRSNTGSPAGSGPTSWSLRSSLDGFTADIATGSMTLSYVDYTVSPGSGFLNLYTTVAFRLYGYNTTIGSGGNSRLVVDNITVKGAGYLLPVKLGSLNAAIMNDDKVTLSFAVYNTEKNSRYLIERSTDGINFAAISTIEETANMPAKKYTCTDDLRLTPSVPQFYYRIQAINYSGTVAYSASAILKRTVNDSVIKTFIRNQQLYISGTFTHTGNYRVDLYTVAGQAIWRTSFTAAGGYNSLVLPLSKALPANCVIHLSGKGYAAGVLLVNP